MIDSSDHTVRVRLPEISMELEINEVDVIKGSYGHEYTVHLSAISQSYTMFDKNFTKSGEDKINEWNLLVKNNEDSPVKSLNLVVKISSNKRNWEKVVFENNNLDINSIFDIDDYADSFNNDYDWLVKYSGIDRDYNLERQYPWAYPKHSRSLYNFNFKCIQNEYNDLVQSCDPIIFDENYGIFNGVYLFSGETYTITAELKDQQGNLLYEDALDFSHE